MPRRRRKERRIRFVTAGELLDRMSDPSVKSFKILEIAADMSGTRMRELATIHGFAITAKTKDRTRPRSTTWLHFRRYA